MRAPALLTAAVIAVSLTACGTADVDPSSSPTGSPPAPQPTASATVSPSVPPLVDEEIPAGLAEDPRVKEALEDARGRVGIVPSDVEITGYSKVTWDDGSLGCPEKDGSYTQMAVEGEILLISADQRTMAYHAAQGQPFAFCASPGDNVSPRS